ncbi:MAG: RNA polymerase sigma factor [Candidatus Eiseniibacteriota bacterium]
MEDSELVTRSLAGDANAFGELVERYQRVLFQLAFRILRDREEARDATQAAFVKAWTHLSQFDRSRRFFSWIYRIQMNEAFNRRTRARTHEELDPNLVSGEAGPEDSHRRTQVQAMIADALVELSPEGRDVVVLRHWLNLSYEEIAEQVHVPPKTVKSRLFAARQKLAEILRRRGFDPA